MSELVQKIKDRVAYRIVRAGDSIECRDCHLTLTQPYESTQHKHWCPTRFLITLLELLEGT